MALLFYHIDRRSGEKKFKSTVWAMSATAIATISTTPQIVGGEDQCLTLKIIIFTFLQQPAQQIYVHLLENIFIIQIAEHFRVNDMGKDFSAFNYTWAGPREVRIGVHTVNSSIAHRRQFIER